MYNLDDKITVITGAASGIGKSCALAFAGENAKLILMDKNEEGLKLVGKEIGEKHDTPTCVTFDITKESEVKKAVGKIIDIYGRIDILVNCAGVSTMNVSWELTEEEWDYNMDVNAKGCWLICKYVIPHMIKENKGRIVLTASMGGKQGAPFLAHYCASKFAVIGLCESIAKEVAKYNITVNSVCPGYVKTPMQDREVGWEAKLRGIDDPEKVREEYISLTPLGRLSVPSDIAKGVLFLASDQADFITAESIKISGGQL